MLLLEAGNMFGGYARTILPMNGKPVSILELMGTDAEFVQEKTDLTNHYQKRILKLRQNGIPQKTRA
jgi:hypothetical protein